MKFAIMSNYYLVFTLIAALATFFNFIIQKGFHETGIGICH